MIDCNEWRTEKRHECANLGKVKRLELWWLLYRTSLPVRDLENFRPIDFCSTVYELMSKKATSDLNITIEHDRHLASSEISITIDSKSVSKTRTKFSGFVFYAEGGHAFENDRYQITQQFKNLGPIRARKSHKVYALWTAGNV